MFEKLEDLAKNNKKISDFHIRCGSPLAYRQTGEIIKVADAMVTAQDLQDLLSMNCNEEELNKFEKTHELDSAVMLSGLRFRANFYKTIKGPAAVLRRVESKIPEMSDFVLPEVLYDIIDMHKGLVLVTGPTGSGKSTIANALMVKLMEMGGRPVTLLDGDIVRKNLSSELGFSKEHRDLNIRRIGYVASEITKNGGIAICAPIAPYATTRRAVREDVEAFGAFVEVHVATSIEACEHRDRKGLYKLARAGKIKEFTGISDPYDVPKKPELKLETEGVAVDTCAHQILLKLESVGLIGA